VLKTDSGEVRRILLQPPTVHEEKDIAIDPVISSQNAAGNNYTFNAYPTTTTFVNYRMVSLADVHHGEYNSALNYVNEKVEVRVFGKNKAGKAFIQGPYKGKVVAQDELSITLESGSGASSSRITIPVTRRGDKGFLQVISSK
jgi:hypothetical protein